MDDGASVAHYINLTLEFLGFLRCFSSFRVAAEDLFGAYIFSVAGASGLFLKQVAQFATG